MPRSEALQLALLFQLELALSLDRVQSALFGRNVADAVALVLQQQLSALPFLEHLLFHPLLPVEALACLSLTQ